MTSSKYTYCALFFICLLTIQCATKVNTIHIATSDHQAIKIIDVDPAYPHACRDPLNYAPLANYLDYFDPKTIRLNFHFPDDSSRTNNFPPKEGNQYFTWMVNNINERLAINEKMNLPEGNNTPNLHPRYGCTIVPSQGHEEDNGFYYETMGDLAYFINKGKNSNNYKGDIIKQYAIDDDTILNVFVMPHHPDSMKSKTYKAQGSGIALGSSVKVAGIYQFGGPDWGYATLLSHEIGHVLGLGHSWYSDGCDDTPAHTNCFHKSEVPPCDGAVSNNLMDYNNSQMALTPCQIGKIHMNLSDTSAFQRALTIPFWCHLDPTYDINIIGNVTWPGARDVSHHIVIHPGSNLTVCCRLSMPEGSSIHVMPGARLTLKNATIHNDCGETWQGIYVHSRGKKSGIVETAGPLQLLNVQKHY